MSRFAPSTLRRVALAVGLVTIALILAELALMFANRGVRDPDLQTWDVANVSDVITSLGVPVIGMVLSIRVPSNSYGLSQVRKNGHSAPFAWAG